MSQVCRVCKFPNVEERILEPVGGIKYTGPDGVECTYTVFFTRIINETDNPLELKINFPGDSYELPSIPGQYFKILLPPDTMTLDKDPLFIYGLTNSESFLDNNRNKSSWLNRTSNPKESSGIYVVKFNMKPNRVGKVMVQHEQDLA